MGSYEMMHFSQTVMVTYKMIYFSQIVKKITGSHEVIELE